MDRTTALISVKTDGFVDGASFSGASDAEFREEAERNGFEVREVDRAYAKQVVFTTIEPSERTIIVPLSRQVTEKGPSMGTYLSDVNGKPGK